MMHVTEEVNNLRAELDALDEEIMHMISIRTELAKHIGDTKVAQGQPRITTSREATLITKYKRELGFSGGTIASALLYLSRGLNEHL